MKQNTKTVTAPRVSTIKPKTTKSGVKVVKNSDGFDAIKKDEYSELYLLGVGRFFGEDAFYESGAEGVVRFVSLVRKVTAKDPEWVAAFLKWLRNDANIRTAAIVGAAEYVKAGGANGRAVVKSVLVRADEPAELLAYWIKTYGKRIPQPIKRGIRDAAQRLYNERNFAKWDSASAGVRMADVVELTHPAPQAAWQSDLFKYAIEQRHGRATFDGKALPSLEARAKCSTRDDYFAELRKGNPTISWENVSSADKGKMTAAQWVELYEHMGYMAQLRNLRNLDVAGVRPVDKRKIGEFLANPANVAKSRQLPMRFYSAYKNVNDDVWRGYLQEALDASLDNVPVLHGKWLVLVDASGSMMPYWSSTRSDVSQYEQACVFGAAFAKVNNADMFTYSTRLSPLVPTKANVLSIVRTMDSRSEYRHGGGTDTFNMVKRAFDKGKYDGVLLLTDEQFNGGGYRGDVIPVTIPLYTFNLAGYGHGHNIGVNRVTVGGLSDAGFQMIANAEAAKVKWPWE